MPENATPAPTTGTSPVVAPQPPQPPQQTRTSKSYATKPKISANPAPTVTAPAPTPAAQAPAQTPAATPPAPTASETPSPSPKPETPAATPQAPKLTALDEAKRLANIVRTEGKVAAEKQRLAQERQAIEQQQAAFATERRRLQAMEQARNVPKGQRLGFIQQVFGWKPGDVIEDVIADTARTPEQIAQGQLQQIEQRSQQLTQQIEEFDKRARTEREQAQVHEYVKGTLEPLLNPKDYPFLTHNLGSTAAQQMYAVMNDAWQKSHTDPKQRRAPDPKELASKAEAWYRKDAEAKATLLGLSVTPQQTANQVAQGGTAPTPTTQATSVSSRSARFQAAPTYRAKHRGG